jgi:hypothetical protein
MYQISNNNWVSNARFQNTYEQLELEYVLYMWVEACL